MATRRARGRREAWLLPVLLVASGPLIVQLAPVDDHFYQSEVQTSIDGRGEGRYHFTAGWHLQHLDVWSEVLAPHRGQPDLRYLEVGVFEGRSLLWMLENILTHPSARATAIDIFVGDYEDTFDANLDASGFGSKVKKIVGPSGDVLRQLGASSFDVIYIDGSHTAHDVLLDATLSWSLLADGGLIIFDDYAWTGRRGGDSLPDELRPQLAIDAFIAANRYSIDIVHRDYQVILRKHPNPCVPKDYCSPLGHYNYFWRARELWKQAGGRVELTAAQIRLVEAVVRARRPGTAEIEIPEDLRDSAELHELLTTLDLQL